MTPKDDSVSLDRKKQILDAAATLFADRGYYKTTTADVAREVGVTQPYVFHFFKTKEALYLAVLEHATTKILYAFDTVEAPPVQLMEAMGLAFMKLLENYRNEIMVVMTSYTIPEPAIRDCIRREMSGVFDRVQARFERAGLPNPSTMASMFIGMGLSISLSEALELPKLCPWSKNEKI